MATAAWHSDMSPNTLPGFGCAHQPKDTLSHVPVIEGQKGTRRVQLVRRDGRDVSTLYGREGGGGARTRYQFYLRRRLPLSAGDHRAPGLPMRLVRLVRKEGRDVSS